MLSAALLISAALAGPWDLPTALALHPVGYDPAARLYALQVEELSGPAASPLFREPLAEAACWYALWEGTGDRPRPEPDAETLRDAAELSAALALEDLLLETLERSEGLSLAFRLGRSLWSPNLELERRPEGWRLGWNEGALDARRARLRVRAEEEGLERGRARNPGLRLGAGLRAVQDEEQAPHRGQEEDFHLDATLYVQQDHLCCTSANLQWELAARRWNFTARQAVLPRTSLTLAVTSREDSPLPQSARPGLLVQLGPSWTLLLRLRQSVPLPPSRDDSRWWSADLRYRPRQPTLLGPRRWPLGQRVGAPGPLIPELHRREAVELSWRGRPWPPAEEEHRRGRGRGRRR